MNWILAYLDAGSGALLLQMVIGGAAGLAAYVRFRWKRLTGRADSSESVPEELEFPDQ